jgi:hypothetical protein
MVQGLNKTTEDRNSIFFFRRTAHMLQIFSNPRRAETLDLARHVLLYMQSILKRKKTFPS